MPLNRRSSGRQGGVHELSAFEQLVVELVRHDDSWPFLKLVSKIQVTLQLDLIKYIHILHDLHLYHIFMENLKLSKHLILPKSPQLELCFQC